jgi:hypothetical protein
VATAKKAPVKKAPAKKAPAKKAPVTVTRGVASAISATSSRSVQYRVVFGKGDEAIEGPDDAAVVFVCSVADAAIDPTVAYMQGKLKATGNTGIVIEQLSSGAAAHAISRLASRL